MPEQILEINKYELSNYPVESYNGPIILVDHEEQLGGLSNYFENESVIGIDTETRPSFRKGRINEVSLLQLATSKAVILIRLHYVPLPAFIHNIFENKSIIKAGIGITDDIRALHKIDDFEQQSFVDLNKMAQQKGFISIGARKLSALVLGFRISKRQQLSNWEAEELSEAQQLYAATDAWVAREIYLKFLNKQ